MCHTPAPRCLLGLNVQVCLFGGKLQGARRDAFTTEMLKKTKYKVNLYVFVGYVDKRGKERKRKPKKPRKQQRFVDREIHDLLTSGAIEERQGQPHCVSPIGCIPKKKKKKKFRLIVDLRLLNSVSKTFKFQYESISMVCDQGRPHDSLVTLDFKNRFHHIPVHSDHRKFLGSVFFSAKRAIIQHLRQQGLRLVIYVDVILLMAPPPPPRQR